MCTGHRCISLRNRMWWMSLTVEMCWLQALKCTRKNSHTIVTLAIRSYFHPNSNIIPLKGTKSGVYFQNMSKKHCISLLERPLPCAFFEKKLNSHRLITFTSRAHLPTNVVKCSYFGKAALVCHPDCAFKGECSIWALGNWVSCLPHSTTCEKNDEVKNKISHQQWCWVNRMQ